MTKMTPDYDALATMNLPNALCPIGASVRSPQSASLGVGRILHSEVTVVYPDGERIVHGGNRLVSEPPASSVATLPPVEWLKKHSHQTNDVMTALLKFHEGDCPHFWVEDGVCDLCEAPVDE